MKNPVNDNGLKRNLPKYERSLILLGYIENNLPSLKNHIFRSIQNELSSALSQGYSQKDISETKGATTLYCHDEDIIIKQVKKLIELQD